MPNITIKMFTSFTQLKSKKTDTTKSTNCTALNLPIKLILNHLLAISCLFCLHDTTAQELDLTIKKLAGDASVVDLQRLIRLGVDKHPLVQQAKGETEASIAEIGIGVAAGKPKIALAIDANTFQGNVRNQSASNSVTLGPSITLRYPLWDRDRIDADVALRTARADATGNQVYVVKLNLARQIGEAYNEVLRQRNLIETNKTYISHLEILNKDLVAISIQDKGRRSDTVLGSSRLETAQAGMSAHIVAMKEAMNNLRKIVNFALKRQSMAIQTADLAALDFEGVFPPTKDLILAALDSHPSLLRARADIETAKKQSVVAAVSNKPTTNLETSINSPRDFDGDVKFLSQFQLRIVRSWDAYDGGAADAAKKAADARVEVATSNYDNVKQDLESELDTLWTSLTERQERIDVLFSGVSLSKEVRDNAKTQFKAGKKSLLDLLNFESDVFNAELNLSQERSELSLLQIKLLAQSGKLLEWSNQ